MVEGRRPLNVQTAFERVMAYAHEGAVQHVPIEESYGRFLAEDLAADHPVPPFDRSPYDGFAIHAADTKGATHDDPVQIDVIGEIGAGSVFDRAVGERQAVRIMTGAQIPAGCDAVEMLEAVEEETVAGQPAIEIKREFNPNDNISFMGEDTAQGEVLVSKGSYINPGIVALLATFGYKYVPVSRKPRVGIIATGSELLAIDEPIKPGKIRNSNAHMAMAQIERAGGEAVYVGQFSDDFETCYHQVAGTLDQVDLLMTTGGVSVGDYDYLPDIYDKLGAHVLFNKVAMRPGSVTTVAEKDGKLLFGLSGNPSACYVGFELFARPVIRTFLAALNPALKNEQAVLGADFPKKNPFDRFVRGHVSFHDGKLVATPSGLDKSNVVSSLKDANSLIIFPGGTRGYQEGMDVNVMLLEDQEGAPLRQDTQEGSLSHE